MKGPRTKWLRVALAVGGAIAAHALDPGSAGAATIAPRSANDAPAGIVLAGLTSQNLPVFFKVARDARSLTLAAIAVDMNCTSGAEFVLPDGFARVGIGENGRLHAAVSQPPTAGTGGETYSWTDSVAARMNRKHTQFAGVWRLKVNYSFTNGMSDQCDSGPVRFAATG